MGDAKVDDAGNAGKFSTAMYDENTYNTLIKQDVNDPQFQWKKKLDFDDKNWSASIHQQQTKGPDGQQMGRADMVMKGCNAATMHLLMSDMETMAKKNK